MFRLSCSKLHILIAFQDIKLSEILPFLAACEELIRDMNTLGRNQFNPVSSLHQGSRDDLSMGGGVTSVTRHANSVDASFSKEVLNSITGSGCVFWCLQSRLPRSQNV